MSRRSNDDDDEGPTATQIVSGGITIAQICSPGIFQRVIFKGYQAYQKAAPIIHSVVEKASVLVNKSTPVIVEKAGQFGSAVAGKGALVVDKAAAAAPTMLPIAIAVGAAGIATEVNAKKRENIKTKREARKNTKVTAKLNLEHQLEGHCAGKAILERELKMTESDIDLQTEKMYAVNDILYDDNTQFIVTLGITGDGKSTICNRLYGDKSAEGNQGPFVTKDGADSETQRIKCKKVNINRTNYVIVDTPGFDDSKGGDVDHANNLASHLNAWGGVNSFVLIQNGINIRLKESIQVMLTRFEAHFGANDFWSHLIIALTSIETKAAIKKIDGKKQSLINKINHVFPESKKHVIPITPIGFYQKSQISSFLNNFSVISIFGDSSGDLDPFEDGYDYSEWRLQLLENVSDDKVLCNNMTPPLKLLQEKRNRLNGEIGTMNHKINNKRNMIKNLTSEIATIQHEIDNAANFVLFD